MPIVNKRYYMNPSYGQSLESARQRSEGILKPIIESLESNSIRPLLKIFEDNRPSHADDLIPQDRRQKPPQKELVSAHARTADHLAGAQQGGSAAREPQESDAQGHWVTLDHRHVFIQKPDADRPPQHHQQPSHRLLPSSGEASIYSDIFEGEKTSNGEAFHQKAYTAALLPRSRWHAVPLGTRVEITHDGSSVVVEVNDRGAGDKDPSSTRALDLSRTAASALIGGDIKDDKDAKKVGLIHLDTIRVVPKDTPLEPVRH